MGRKIERWRGKGEIGVEISVIWSRRRDAWTYLGGADAGEEKRGFSYPNEAEAWNKRRVPHTVTSRIIPKGGKRAKPSPRASVAALHVVCVCVYELLANQLANSICGGGMRGKDRGLLRY